MSPMPVNDVFEYPRWDLSLVAGLTSRTRWGATFLI